MSPTLVPSPIKPCPLQGQVRVTKHPPMACGLHGPPLPSGVEGLGFCRCRGRLKGLGAEAWAVDVGVAFWKGSNPSSSAWQGSKYTYPYTYTDLTRKWVHCVCVCVCVWFFNVCVCVCVQRVVGWLHGWFCTLAAPLPRWSPPWAGSLSGLWGWNTHKLR